MSSHSHLPGRALALAAALCVWVPSAKADPVAEGYDLYALTTIGWPRAIDRRNDQLLVLTVRGDLIEVDRAGNQTEVTSLGSGTWIDPAYDPGTGHFFASNLSSGYVARYAGGDPEVLVSGIPGAAGIALSDDGGTVYVASYTGNQIHAYDIPTELGWTCTTSHRPDGLEYWNGSLYIANRGDGRIDVMDDVLLCQTPEVCAHGMFSQPIGIGRGDDDLLVADFGNGKIFRLGSDCVATEIASGFNGPVGAVQIGQNIFVSEYNTNTIWLLAPYSIRGTVAGLAPPIDVTCQNVTQVTEETVTLGIGECDYNCTLAGLDAEDGDTINILIDGETPNPSIAPGFELTEIPPIGSTANLIGFALVPDPENYAVATYIKVSGGWWTKPYWAYPTVPLDQYGNFAVDITTGGNDPSATEIVTYLVPHDYIPPRLGGQATLPLVLDAMNGDCSSFSVAKASAVRTP